MPRRVPIAKRYVPRPHATDTMKPVTIDPRATPRGFFASRRGRDGAAKKPQEAQPQEE